jgi:hypothetical protein
MEILPNGLATPCAEGLGSSICKGYASHGKWLWAFENKEFIGITLEMINASGFARGGGVSGFPDRIGFY